MGIFEKGTESHKGQVITTTTHYWLDGMLEERATLWNPEKHETFSIQVGYYGIDGCNLCGMSAKLDLNEENYRDMVETFHKEAEEEYAKYLEDKQDEICKGRICKVVRGKKVPKGAILTVFWCGEKPTFRSRNYSWMHETELIAGCTDGNANTLWIKAAYLEPVDTVEIPTEEEKKNWIEDYVIRRFSNLNINYKSA